VSRGNADCVGMVVAFFLRGARQRDAWKVEGPERWARTALASSRGTPHIFVPFVDGTAEYLRECFCKTPFGVGGLTVVDGGSPLWCMRLMEEMARLDCDFVFLRRSFKRDIVGKDMALEVRRVREAWSALRTRSQGQIERDHRRLGDCIAQTFH
jgi:hypothetical protein